MKKIVAVPLHEQRNPTYTKLFGVSLQDLHQQGLTENGVPAIVGSIVEYLTMHGLTQEGLFRVNGNVKVVEQLRWKFESGVPVELGRDGDVCAAASLLKLFLRELPESVITSTLQPRFLQLFQGDAGDMGSIPGSGRFPGGGKGNPLQNSCLEYPMNKRSLAGCSPRGLKESGMTERLSIHTRKGIVWYFIAHIEK